MCTKFQHMAKSGTGNMETQFGWCTAESNETSHELLSFEQLLQYEEHSVGYTNLMTSHD